MKTFSHTCTTQAPPDAIWNLWSDVSTWHTWDSEIKWSELQGEFIDGQKGTLKPTSGPKIRFYLSDVIHRKSFTSVSLLPLGTKLINEHKIHTENNQTQFTHKVTFTGPLAGVFGFLLGEGFSKVLPTVMNNLKVAAETSTSSNV